MVIRAANSRNDGLSSGGLGLGGGNTAALGPPPRPIFLIVLLGFFFVFPATILVKSCLVAPKSFLETVWKSRKNKVAVLDSLAPRKN